MSRSRWARAVARRAGGPVMHRLARLAGGPPPGLRRGVGRRPADLPVLAVVVVGTTPEAVDGVIAAVRAAQERHDTFTPVFLLDEPVLSPFRRAGYVVELVGPAGLEEALREVRLSYACAGVLTVDGGAPSTWRNLSMLLPAASPGGPRTVPERTRALLRRTEARLR